MQFWETAKIRTGKEEGSEKKGLDLNGLDFRSVTHVDLRLVLVLI